MPALTERVRRVALASSADLVGFAPVERSRRHFIRERSTLKSGRSSQWPCAIRAAC
jgi:hypothetical protein